MGSATTSPLAKAQKQAALTEEAAPLGTLRKRKCAFPGAICAPVLLLNYKVVENEFGKTYAMKIKLNPFKQSHSEPNGLAPAPKSFQPGDMIPMPKHWETMFVNPVAGSKPQALPPLSGPSGAMPILIAEDHKNSSLILKVALEKAGYAPIVTSDGLEAMAVLRAANAPRMAVLDWMMPGMNGLEVCRRVRNLNKLIYVIFLTACATSENIVEALEAGADDYLTKPFKSPELIARIHVGLRIVNLQDALRNRVQELQKALLELKNLHSRLSLPL